MRFLREGGGGRCGRRHGARFGAQFVHLRQNYTFGIAGQIADAQFANTQGFVDGTVQLYSIAVDPKGHLPGESIDPPFGPPNFTRHYHYNEPALFIADTWRINPRLTLTPGLRWEYFGVFHSPGSEEVLDSNFYPGSGANFLVQVADGRMMRTVDAPGKLKGRFYLPDHKNFAPRMGLAYDPFGDGKTAVRAGGVKMAEPLERRAIISGVGQSAIGRRNEAFEQQTVVRLVLQTTLRLAVIRQQPDIGIVCRDHARRAAERGDTQARVVGDRRPAGRRRGMTGFDQRVLDEARMRLVGLGNAERTLRDQLDARRREQHV